MVAHNGRRFDFIVLTAAFKSCNLLDKFLCKVIRCVDTLPVLKAMYPNASCHKQEVLAMELLDLKYEAHNAEADVHCLCNLVSFR